MGYSSGYLLLSFVILVTVTIVGCSQVVRDENGVKTAVFLSPAIVLEPGLVSNKNYYNIDFPRGHIAIKHFYAELVDEVGNSVPLHETYIHHWVMERYYQREETMNLEYDSNMGLHQSDFVLVRNSGLCDLRLTQYFGLGSETRRTKSHIPDPYGVEVGNSLDIPPGYDERWVLNVHAIDTRGVEDKFGCIECRCDLYNVTKDLRPGYIGGLSCCADGRRCRVKEGFQSERRTLYLRYTVEYVEWDNYIIPVKIYILDVTDSWKRSNESVVLSSEHHCQVEYNVLPSSTYVDDHICIDSRKVSLSFPIDGDVIYSVGHQHAAGIGSTLYGEDGRAICSSIPIYGEGEEAGNEAGYVVGMTSCYPQPGSVKISQGEILTVESKYSCNQMHTGVMGFIYLLIADSSPRPDHVFRASLLMSKLVLIPMPAVVGLVLVIAVVAAALVAHRRQNQREDDYKSIMS